MLYEVGVFGLQTWNIALDLGYRDKLSWTKPLPNLEQFTLSRTLLPELDTTRRDNNAVTSCGNRR